jgi:hypothetical protein
MKCSVDQVRDCRPPSSGESDVRPLNALKIASQIEGQTIGSFPEL